MRKVTAMLHKEGLRCSCEMKASRSWLLSLQILSVFSILFSISALTCWALPHDIDLEKQPSQGQTQLLLPDPLNAGLSLALAGQTPLPHFP